MNMNLNKDMIARRLFGITVTDAVSKKQCLTGHNVAGHIHTPLGAKRYSVAGICEDCCKNTAYRRDEYEEL